MPIQRSEPSVPSSNSIHIPLPSSLARQVPVTGRQELHPLVVRSPPAEVGVTLADVQAVNQNVEPVEECLLAFVPELRSCSSVWPV